MELYIAVALASAGLLFYFWQGMRVRAAWKDTAAQLGLEFKNALWLPSISMKGKVDGLELEVRYVPQRFLVPQGSTGRTRSDNAYWTAITVSGADIPFDWHFTHPENDQLLAIKGTVRYPAEFGSPLQHIRPFHAWKHKHITNSDKMVALIGLMVQWAKALEQSYREGGR